MRYSLNDFDSGLIDRVDDLARTIDDAIDQLNQIDQDYGLTDRMAIAKLDLGRTYDAICTCLLYTSPSPRDGLLSRMPSSA